MSAVTAEANVESLQDALRRLDNLLSKALAAAKVAYGPEAAGDPYRGLYIGDADVARLLGHTPGNPALQWPDWNDEECLIDVTDESSRWCALKQSLQLSCLDVDAILIALAPELDLRYERLYGYLQDDVTKKWPTVDLVLNLRCATFEQRLAARDRFAPSAPLIRENLLRISFDSAQPESSPLIARQMRVDGRIVSFLLGRDDVDPKLNPAVRRADAPSSAEDAALPADFRARLRALCADTRGACNSLKFVFVGPDDAGKQQAARALARELGLEILLVDTGRLARVDSSFDELIDLVRREALLTGAAVYWDQVDALGTDGPGIWHREALLEIVSSHPGVMILGSATPWISRRLPLHPAFLIAEFPIPISPVRETLWRQHLQSARIPLPDHAIKGLAEAFTIGEGKIRGAVASAETRARWRDPQQPEPTVDDVFTGARAQSAPILQSAATRITPIHRWDDIVLPPDAMSQLKEICERVVHRHTVFEDWGFHRKLSLGKGISALFAGPSGTGKTMAAGIIARELGLDLYRIDVANVVSKYIGETEKNLDRVFAEASTTNAILFFDEADALFGKRSEVKDAHDRYANIEISYLLQAMEQYEGLAILATNLKQNMDDAFARRLAFTVMFPFPDEPDRLRIWQRSMPKELPLASDIELDFMARRFKLAGGNIRNIVLAAAFAAAADGGVVGMDHLIRATRREFQKLGKVCVETDFGPYYRLVETR